jgi:RND family efflux transporter MFP subunit
VRQLLSDPSPRRLAPWLLIALGPLILIGCGKAAPTEPAAPTPVEVVTGSLPNTGQTLLATGALKRQREMTLSFRIPGVITQLSVDDGDPVRAGQVIATLDPAAVDSRLRQAAADLDRARRDEARYVQLADAGVVSRQRAEAQRSGAASAQAAYDAAAFDRRWARLVAPATGVVLARNAQAGEVVQPGQAVVVMADEASPLVLRAPLSDRDISKVAIGTLATVTLDALPGQALTAKVSRIGQRAGAQSGAVEIEITLPNRPGLRSGMIATARIMATPGSVAPQAHLKLPAEAILEANGKTAFVMTYDPASRKARRVAVGFAGFDGDDALVSGLAAGTQVITAGAGYVTDGQSVRVIDPKALGTTQ